MEHLSYSELIQGLTTEFLKHKNEQNSLAMSQYMKGRFAFSFYNHQDRIKTPLIAEPIEIIDPETPAAD